MAAPPSPPSDDAPSSDRSERGPGSDRPEPGAADPPDRPRSRATDHRPEPGGPDLCDAAAPTPRADDRGLSKVVGVALMLAIVVALAATTATLALGLLETDEPVPQAEFSFDYETGVSDSNCDDPTCGVVRIHHYAGDTFDPERVEVVVHYTDGGDRETFSATWADVRPNDVDAGDRVRVWTNDPIDDLSDARIELVWTGPDGERSAIVDEWEGPAA